MYIASRRGGWTAVIFGSIPHIFLNDFMEGVGWRAQRAKGSDFLENFIGQGLGVPMGEGNAKWGRGSAWGEHIYLFIKLRKKNR